MGMLDSIAGAEAQAGGRGGVRFVRSGSGSVSQEYKGRGSSWGLARGGIMKVVSVLLL